MATNLLWFVMAGFLLGFATSTLWEWFYFRKERLKLNDRRIRELEAKLRDPETATDSIPPTSAIPTIASVTSTSTTTSPISSSISSRTSAWGDTAYRSPGVFLESEEYEGDSDENAMIGRERPRPPFAGTPSSAQTPNAQATNATSPAASNFVPIMPTPQPESTVVPRNEQTPADALRAKRGDSPRSRQEVLAALRRNSEAAQRGQLPRNEGETSSDEAVASLLPRGNRLVSPISPASTEPAAIVPPVHAVSPVEESPSTAAPTTVSVARQRWADNPALTERTQEYPDDLSKIKGIGDVYKQRLYRAGIYTWKQIAEGDIESLRRATSAYPSSNVEEWLVQAQKLMEKHGRMNAVYTGPQPDDMTKILGIGPVSAAALYRAGICTYEQLASTSIANLEEMFPIAVAGDQPDFAQWVARAAALADEKHRDN